MDTIDISTTIGVAALASIFFQIAIKPILESWLKRKDGAGTVTWVSPFYGLVAVFVLALVVLGAAALGAVSGRTFDPDKFVDLAIGGYVLAIAGYELVKNGAQAIRGLSL